jgi:hypothetical protein
MLSKGCKKINSSITLIEKKCQNLDMQKYMESRCYISLLTLLYNKMMGYFVKTLLHLLEV